MRGLLKVLGMILWGNVCLLLFSIVGILWLATQYLWASVASAALIVFIRCMQRPHRLNVWLRVLILFAMVAVILYCVFIADIDLGSSDAEDCFDDGICSENFISDEECLKDEGVWFDVGGRRLCYLEWATARPAVIKALKKECEQAGKVWDDDKLRCLGE